MRSWLAEHIAGRAHSHTPGAHRGRAEVASAQLEILQSAASGHKETVTPVDFLFPAVVQNILPF